MSLPLHSKKRSISKARLAGERGRLLTDLAAESYNYEHFSHLAVATPSSSPNGSLYNREEILVQRSEDPTPIPPRFTRALLEFLAAAPPAHRVPQLHGHADRPDVPPATRNGTTTRAPNAALADLLTPTCGGSRAQSASTDATTHLLAQIAVLLGTAFIFGALAQGAPTCSDRLSRRAWCAARAFGRVTPGPAGDSLPRRLGDVRHAARIADLARLLLLRPPARDRSADRPAVGRLPGSPEVCCCR
jgi:hypothetical protein